MFSWGYNSNGELGIGNTSNQTVPKEVSLKGVVTKVIMRYRRYTYDIQLICKLYTLPHVRTCVSQISYYHTFLLSL